MIDQIVIKDDVEPQKLEGSNISSHPELHSEPMSVKLSPSKGGPETAALAFRFGVPDAMHGLKLNIPDFAIGEAFNLSQKAAVAVQEGRAALNADGSFSKDALKVPFALAVNGLKARMREGESVLGLDPQTSQEVFKSLEALKIDGVIEGTLTSPRLKLDKKQLLASLKEALVKAGKAELARRADEQIQRLRGEVSEKLGTALKEKLPGKLGGETTKKIEQVVKDKLPQGLTEGLGKFLPGGAKKETGEKKEADKKGADKKDEKKTKGTDLLKKLF